MTRHARITIAAGVACLAGASALAQPAIDGVDDATIAAIRADTNEYFQALEAHLAGRRDAPPSTTYWKAYAKDKSPAYRESVKAAAAVARFETLRQLDRPELAARFLHEARVHRHDPQRYEQFRLWALSCIELPQLNHRLAGLRHLAARRRDNLSVGDEQQLATIHQVTIEMLRETGGRFPEQAVAMAFLTREDAGKLRAIYNKRFRGSHQTYNPLDFGYQSRQVGKPEDQGNRRGTVEVMLASLRDPGIEVELRRSLAEIKDPSRRAWALIILGAARRTDFTDLMVEALSDRTVIPIPISDHIRDPDAKGPHLQAIVYSRVCDVAARSLPYAHKGIDALSEDQFDFEIPLPGILCRRADSVYEFRRVLSEREFNEDMRRIERGWVMGFTSSQLGQLRDHYGKNTDQGEGASRGPG